MQRRDPGRERQALDELAAWAYQFSARIAFEPSLLLLEVGASRRLFGGLPILLQRLRHELEQVGYSARHALAPTPTAAGLLARSRPACEVDDVQALRDSVAPLPLACLTRERAVRELVRHIGLQTIGDVLELPRAGLARRSDPALPALLDRLLGRADPREWSPPRHFVQTIELLGEIGQSTALVFPARRLMVALCGFLRGLGGGAQLQWTLQHRDDCPATRFGQGLLDPSRDPVTCSRCSASVSSAWSCRRLWSRSACASTTGRPSPSAAWRFDVRRSATMRCSSASAAVSASSGCAVCAACPITALSVPGSCAGRARASCPTVHSVRPCRSRWLLASPQPLRDCDGMRNTAARCAWRRCRNASSRLVRRFRHHPRLLRRAQPGRRAAVGVS